MTNIFLKSFKTTQIPSKPKRKKTKYDQKPLKITKIYPKT